MTFPKSIDEYIGRYGQVLAGMAQEACKPLHTPGVDPVINVPLLRKPFDAQAHLITANIKALAGSTSVLVSGSLGTGKTVMSLGVAHGHAAGKGYRAIVLCPPHLVNKWKREIETTVPNAYATIVEGYQSVTALRRGDKAVGSGYWIVSNSKAKLGPKWRSAILKRRKINGEYDGFAYCPKCGERQYIDDRVSGERMMLESKDFDEDRRNCCNCGEQLWQWTGGLDRWPVASYVHKHLKGYFDYCVIDEAHQSRSAESAIGFATGSVIAACKYSILLSGTILGGRALDIKHILYRTAPRSLGSEGIGWRDDLLFNERYGRFEKTIKITEKRGKDGKQNRRQSKTNPRLVPGVMPQLFTRHMIERTTFLGLDEITDHLPEMREETIHVEMDKNLKKAYAEVEEKLTEAVRMLLAQRNSKLLSKMLTTLLGYTDHPYGWGEIGWTDDDGRFIKVCEPKELAKDFQYAKERAIVAECLKERSEGRKSWVYAVMTGKRDVVGRLAGLMTASGLKVAVLRSEIPTTDREEWIAANAPKADVLISHPQLVETGLDFFDNSPRTYNIPTIMFAQAGYALYTLRQAAGRHFRIGQDQPCRTKYFFYKDTMQARAMTLMGRKMAASLAIEGRFSSEGLAAMAGDEGSLEMALAKSLVDRLDDTDVSRAWEKLKSPIGGKIPPEKTTPGPVIQSAMAFGKFDPSKNAPGSTENDPEAWISIGRWARLKGSQTLPVKICRVDGDEVSICQAGERDEIPYSRDVFLEQYSPLSR